MKLSTIITAGALAVGTVLVPIPASAVITLFQDFGAGNLDIDYGATGAATLGAFYRLPSGTESSLDVASVSGLGFNAFISGFGTGQVQVTYDLTNTTSSATAPLKFFAEVDPDGDTRGTIPTFMDIPGSTIVAGAREPSRFSLDDVNSVSPDLDFDIVSTGELNNLNTCGAFCDLVFAFQWDIPALNPGETARVVVSLSDTGAHLSDSFLTATRADALGNIVPPEQVFTFSGQLDVIPEPQTWALLFAGLGLLGLKLSRRRRV